MAGAKDEAYVIDTPEDVVVVTVDHTTRKLLVEIGSKLVFQINSFKEILVQEPK